MINRYSIGIVINCLCLF